MPINATILSSLIFQPAAAPSRIIAGSLLLAVLAVAAYWRTCGLSTATRILLVGLRLTTIALLAGILLGPSAARSVHPEPYRRKLVIALDTSRSFGTKDVGTRSRFEVARETWRDPGLINKLRERFDLRFYRYDDQLTATGPGLLWEISEPAGRQTCIAATITRLLATEFAHAAEPAGILLIGDGHETGAGDPVAAATAAGQAGVPIWTSCFGGTTENRDIAVITASAQESLFTGQTGRIVAKLVQSGFGLDTVTVVLRREGRVVQQIPTALGDRAVSEVAFDIRENRPGLYEYEIRAEPMPGEADTANNSRAVFVRVHNEKIKVLLVEAQPYWDTKFLAQCLRSDPQVDLTQIVRYGRTGLSAIRNAATQPADREPREQIVPLPRTLEDLAAYDVLIFGKGLPEYLPPERLGILKEYLGTRGGAIVFARGRPYDPTTRSGAEAARVLSALEPAIWGNEYVRELRLELTPEGRLHPAFRFLAEAQAPRQRGDTAVSRPSDLILKELPGMIGAVRVRKEKAAALVLARAAGTAPPTAESDAPMAAVAYQSYGKGRVVSILSEGLWRWSLLPARCESFEKVAPFDEFWRRMVRWLAGGSEFLPGQDVALTIAEFPENLGGTARIEVRMKHPPRVDTPATLTVIDPDGQAHPVPLGRPRKGADLLHASFEAKLPGVYRVTLSTPEMIPAVQETRFCAYDFSVEMIDTSADPVTMRNVAEASGGQYIDSAEPQRLLSLLEKAHPTRQGQREAEFVWDRPWVFVTIVTMLAVEWFMRRRRGVA